MLEHGEVCGFIKTSCMCNSKTMEELMRGISSLAENVNWNNDEVKGIICLSYSEGDVMCNAYGKSNAVIYSILNMMINDTDVRNIVCTAYKAYIDYSAKNFSKVYGPMVKQIEKVMKEQYGSENADLVPCIFSSKIEPKS